MADTPYVDNRYIYNPETEKILHNGKEFPITKDMMEEANKQTISKSYLDKWIALSNDDLKKTSCLYALLDQELFYDKLSNNDKKRFADTLIEMSKDDINFEQQNINFFIKFAEYIMENYESAEKFITINEHDKALKQLAEEYYNFNEEKFLNLMREEQSRTK